MSEAAEMIQRAKEIHHRLLFPPNAVPDAGINLKRKQIPPKAPPPPPIEKIERVIEYLQPSQLNLFEPIKIHHVLKAVCLFYNTPIAELKGENRTNRMVKARHIAMYLARKHVKLSYPIIGRRIRPADKPMDHSSVLHACRKIAEIMLVDKDLVEDMKAIESIIFAGLAHADNSQPTVAAEREQPMAAPPLQDTHQGDLSAPQIPKLA